jgi:hypothetical protein
LEGGGQSSFLTWLFWTYEKRKILLLKTNLKNTSLQTGKRRRRQFIVNSSDIVAKFVISLHGGGGSIVLKQQPPAPKAGRLKAPEVQLLLK